MALLGLVGTPPTAVFVAKLATMAATWDAGAWWLTVAIAVNTVLSLVYYVRWLAACLRERADPESDVPLPAASAAPARVAGLAAVAAVGLGVAAGPLLALAG